ncbi:hypothetical protein M422DRAFT_38440 [Sphaerobolus stellatus SS14]|uniref:SGNH hydrolase-type esterase domain-containing protein n=1 Tax=Sphaerobolus stellatus (strain SS14) TaxID=990650 RepID=A0A0C9TVL0_SPHS4|nr:hypothetical protein M422DRAFT_38440 [Sphaerobolus stellatus SS14]
MPGIRQCLFRGPQAVTLLILVNVCTLFLWYNDRKDLEVNIFNGIEGEAYCPHPHHHAMGPATVTHTETVAETVLSRPKAEVAGPAFCDSCGPHDLLCLQYGDHTLARSRVYEGANARFRRVIKKAMAGRPIKIGVLGGSVTNGHGLKQNKVENWTARYLKAWKALFPRSETVLINGAVPATGSGYFSMCWGEHIEEDMDLIIIELAINDQRIEENAVAYEWLLRGLLDLPKKPAILNLQTIGLAFPQISTGGDLHTPISAYYDTPVISLRNALAQHIYNNASLDEHYFSRVNPETPDWRHVNVHGHKLMSDLLLSYTQRQLCAIEREKHDPRPWIDSSEGKLPGTDILEDIPRLRLLQKYDRTSITSRVKPFCLSTRTKKHPLVPMESEGWEMWTYQGRLAKPYLRATEPGSYAKFDVQVGVMNRVRVTYLRSKTFGLGDVWCWIDGNKKGGTRLSGYWNVDNVNIAIVGVVSDKTPPGKHVLTCEVMQETNDQGKGHEFRMIAVDAS